MACSLLSSSVECGCRVVECAPALEIMQLGSQALKLGGKGRGGCSLDSITPVQGYVGRRGGEEGQDSVHKDFFKVPYLDEEVPLLKKIQSTKQHQQ